MKPTKKFHVFHQGRFGETAQIIKRSAPAENAVITAPDSQQKARVMGKAVRQSIHRALRQPDSKVTASDGRIIHDSSNLIQTPARHCGICMQKPEKVTAGHAGGGIHLSCPVALPSDNLVTKPRRKLSGAIDTSAVGHDDFGSGRPLAQMLEKRAYQWRLIINWNNDRNPHSNNSSNHPQSGKTRLGQALLLSLKLENLRLYGIKDFYGASIKQEKAHRVVGALDKH
jgi:hypothetical protein